MPFSATVSMLIPCPPKLAGFQLVDEQFVGVIGNEVLFRRTCSVFFLCSRCFCSSWF